MPPESNRNIHHDRTNQSKKKEASRPHQQNEGFFITEDIGLQMQKQGDEADEEEPTPD